MENNKKRIEELPSAIDCLEELINEAESGNLAIFLDYDGTLTPIVDDPAKALLDEQQRKVIKDLSTLCLVGIISGRDRADVAARVNINSLFYAGSHGYDISGPSISYLHESGLECLPLLDKAEQELTERLKYISGAKVERKKFAIAVHYRHVAEEDVSLLLHEVNNILERYKGLKPGPGKLIMELKPAYDWHKGKALLWMLEKVASDKSIYPIFIGDDQTDEDAFREIKSNGAGILVGDHGAMSDACYRLKNTDEVHVFLRKLKDYLKQF
ncbi:MAG TPA: trehalose-phosphatase [Cytophagaceae bacterium]